MQQPVTRNTEPFDETVADFRAARWTQETATVDTCLPGQLLLDGRYRLVQWLGRGGMGEVLEAFDQETGQHVAVKKMSASRLGRRGLVQACREIRNEFRILASLQHPNVVRVFDCAVDENGVPYFTMELLTGARSIVKAGAETDADGRLELVIQMLNALDHLHRRGILHRDIKPSNVVVAADGSLRLLDFGIAIPEQKAVRVKRPTGTISYLAPEIVGGGLPSRSSDLFAGGLIAYHVLAGQHPFTYGLQNTEEDDELHGLAVLLDRIVNEAPDLELMEANGIVRSVVGRLLEKDPAERYTSASAAVRDLQAANRFMARRRSKALAWLSGVRASS